MALKMVAVRGAYPNREVGAGGRTYRSDDDGVVWVEIQHLPEMLRRGFSRTALSECTEGSGNVFADLGLPRAGELLALANADIRPLPVEDIPSEPPPPLSEVLTEEVLEPAPAPLAAVLVDRARIVRRKPTNPRGRPRKAVAG